MFIHDPNPPFTTSYLYYHNYNNNITFVSFPLNELTSLITNSFICIKSDEVTLPEPSNINAISAWARQSAKIKIMIFRYHNSAFMVY